MHSRRSDGPQAVIPIPRAEALITAGTRLCVASQELASRSRKRVDSTRRTCFESRHRLERNRTHSMAQPEVEHDPLPDNVIPLQPATRGKVMPERRVAEGPFAALLWELGEERVRALAVATLDALEGLDAAAVLEELTKLRTWIGPPEA